ncbi:hypothetical protein XENOCAPTIV_007543, partial [Xenoophorus captivus]
IWSMLPGFCTCPVDLMASFKGVARTLGMSINERPDLRLTVCQALRTLINKSCSTGSKCSLRLSLFTNCCIIISILNNSWMHSVEAEEKAELGRFSKNFLPILFNVYSQQPAEGESGTYRMAVLDTIKVYLTVTDMQRVIILIICLVLLFWSSPPLRLAVMDLVVAMAPFVDESTMAKTFELMRPYLEAKEPGMQKKAYRVLEEMCGAERDECKSFVVSNLETLKIVLLDTLKNASSPAKRVRSLYREEDIVYARVLFIFSPDYFVLGFPQPRLKCLIHIVIICTKEVSVGARKNAYSLLVEIGSAFVRFCGNKKGDAMFLSTCRFGLMGFVQQLTLPASNVDAMEEYLALVYAGLTGSVTMITCTVLALTRLVFEYKGRPD